MNEKRQTILDENQVDWQQFERIGVTREMLEKSNNLNPLLNYENTSLIGITVNVGENIQFRTDARLSLTHDFQNGNKLMMKIHAIRTLPEFDKPYFGFKFTDEDKDNILATGNLGRIATIQHPVWKDKSNVYISIDKQTNELYCVRTDKILVPEYYAGACLNAKQQQLLEAGKPVYVDGMTSKSGEKFSAYIQVNAYTRYIDVNPEKSKKQGTEITPVDVNKVLDNKQISKPDKQKKSKGHKM
jgi:hypothetical protein